MQNEIFETWSKMCQQSLENLKKLGETNMRLGEKLWQEQIELTNTLLETTSRSAEQLAKAKDVSSGAALQAEIMQEMGKQLAESCKSCSDIVAEAGKVYNQVMEKGMQCASDNLAGKPAAAAKRKSA